METLEIQTEPGFTIVIDKSCVLSFWEVNYTNVEIFDKEFEEIWNQLVGDDIEQGFTLDETLYTDESGEIETGYTLWTKFWERVESPDHILLEMNETFIDADNNLVENGLSNSIWYCYLINKHYVTELLNEDFQADAEWIKQKFQVIR